MNLSFNGEPILKNINFTVNKGEVVVIIGSSGCGKSTLLRCINMLEEPDTGHIYFNNEEVAKKYYGKQFKGACLAINTVFIEWHQYEEENHIDITKIKRKELKKLFPQYEKRITLNSVSNYKAWRNCYYGMSDNE